MTRHRSAGKIETKDRRGREGGMAIFSELKIAHFPGLCVASLRPCKINLMFFVNLLNCAFLYFLKSKKIIQVHSLLVSLDLSILVDSHTILL